MVFRTLSLFFVKDFLRFIGVIVFGGCIYSCKSEVQIKIEREILGLWQMKFHEDSLYSYPGCLEFFHDHSWRRHDGCTEEAGTYWIRDDTLFTAVPANFSLYDFDTTQQLVLDLENDEMILYNFTSKDTVYCRRVDESKRDITCWPFH